MAVFWANLAWFFRQPRPGTVGEFVARLAVHPFSPVLLEFFRLLYYLGVPFAALLWGHDAVVGRVLGLKPLILPISTANASNADLTANWLAWTRDTGRAAALGVGVWALLASSWWVYRRALSAIDPTHAVAGTDSSAWTLLREAAYHQAHWAFYRNAPILAVGTYWGAWIGLALVALEATLNPAWRKGLSDPRRAPAQLAYGSLAVASNLLYLQTENLWLALIIHWAISWSLAALARRKT